MPSKKYQSEQAELEEKIELLQSAIATESQNDADAEKWIALMKECVNPTELTAELLNTLIDFDIDIREIQDVIGRTNEERERQTEDVKCRDGYFGGHDRDCL